MELKIPESMVLEVYDNYETHGLVIVDEENNRVCLHDFRMTWNGGPGAIGHVSICHKNPYFFNSNHWNLRFITAEKWIGGF